MSEAGEEWLVTASNSGTSITQAFLVSTNAAYNEGRTLMDRGACGKISLAKHRDTSDSAGTPRSVTREGSVRILPCECSVSSSTKNQQHEDILTESTCSVAIRTARRKTIRC